MLYCIVGPSGSGKTTIVDRLKSYGFKAPDSYTTRPKRFENETGHTFISDEEYEQLKNKVAYTIFNGYKYCVTKEMLDGCDLYVIDPDGVETLKKHNVQFKVIGLMLNSDQCKQRMLTRGDSEEVVNQRLIHDEPIFKNLENISDYKINATKDIDSILQEILKIIKNSL